MNRKAMMIAADISDECDRIKELVSEGAREPLDRQSRIWFAWALDKLDAARPKIAQLLDIEEE